MLRVGWRCAKVSMLLLRPGAASCSPDGCLLTLVSSAETHLPLSKAQHAFACETRFDPAVIRLCFCGLCCTLQRPVPIEVPIESQ